MKPVKLSPLEVEWRRKIIKDMHDHGLTVSMVARIMNLPPSTVSRMVYAHKKEDVDT